MASITTITSYHYYSICLIKYVHTVGIKKLDFLAMKISFPYSFSESSTLKSFLNFLMNFFI